MARSTGRAAGATSAAAAHLIRALVVAAAALAALAALAAAQPTEEAAEPTVVAAEAAAAASGCSPDEMRRRALNATSFARLRPLMLRALYPHCPQAQLDAVSLSSSEDDEDDGQEERAGEANPAYTFRPRPYAERPGLPELVPLAGDLAAWPYRVRGCRALLYVAISPLLVNGVSRRLAELFWDYENCPQRPAGAAIYLGEERAFEKITELDPAPVWRADIGSARGRLLTDFSVPRDLPAGWAQADAGPRPVGEFCRPFRAVLLDADGTHLQTACMMLRPSWMLQLATLGKGSLPLQEMLLPGTHNAGSYARNGEASDGHVTRFLHAQDYSVWEQLVAGVRYLDLRVGYYPDNMGDQRDPGHPDHNQTFWINHDLARVQPLRPVLEAVRAFVDGPRADAVVLHFHRFPVGFAAGEAGKEAEMRRHGELLALLRDLFGDLLIRNEPDFHQRPMRDVLAGRGKVLVSYGNGEFQRRANELLHPAIPQQWGNKQSLADLLAYIEGKLQQRRDSRAAGLAAHMAQLTPTPVSVLLNLQRYSLRNLAREVNENITEKCREAFWYGNANIVAVDFVESTDLVSVAVAANWRLAAYRQEERRLLELEAEALHREAMRQRGWEQPAGPDAASATDGRRRRRRSRRTKSAPRRSTRRGP